MATDRPSTASDLLAGLDRADWIELVRAIDDAVAWLGVQPLSSSDADAVALALARLSTHGKWEVRRAVAVGAGLLRHSALGEALLRLLADSNARVQQAAEASHLRRREWRSTGSLGREHASRVSRTMVDINERFGARGRMAIQRAAAEMVSTFSRELSHEVVRHITPLQREVARLRESIEQNQSRTTLMSHADALQGDINQIMSVLKGMRAYAANPEPKFAEENLREVVAESIHTVSDLAERAGVSIENRISDGIEIEVARVRLIQAISNLLHNALDAYENRPRREPIVIEASTSGEMIQISIQDRGCGMSAETAHDARALFTTNKAQGSGIGLPLAIKIVDAEHDGELAIKSEESKGTTVVITLPRFHRGE